MTALRAALLCAALTPAAAAQSRPHTFVAEGVVSRPTDAGGRPAPVAGQWVVLHRVGSDRAAPMDSVRSGADGRFRFRFRPFGATDALYFVSATYGGIAYFSPPLRSDTVSGGDADVIVYDTTPDTAKLRVQGRHFVLSAPRDGRRDVVEVFELENEGVRTIVARDSATPVLSIALPAGAARVTVGQGDVSAGAVAIRPGRADVFAPMSPGVRQLVLTYTLPLDDFPLSQRVERQTTVLEVLLEEPRASVEGAKLTEVSPATIESRMFRRFLAQEVPANAVMRVTAPAPVASNAGAMRVLAVVMALAMLGAIALWMLRRKRAQAAGARRVPPESEALIAELAALDASFDRHATMGGEARHLYEQERARLKERIARALDAEHVRA